MAAFTAVERDRLAKRIFSHICDREHYDKSSGGQWVTIGGGPGPSGQKHAGGTPVKVGADGKIKAGPDKLEGKSIEQLDKASSPAEAADRDEPKAPKPKATDGPSKTPRKPTAPPAIDAAKDASTGQNVPPSGPPTVQPTPEPPDDNEKLTLKGGRESPRTPKSRQTTLFDKLKEPDSPESKSMPTAAAIARGDGLHRLKNEHGESPPPGVTVLPDGRWTGTATLHAADIRMDPSRFQYKVSGVGSKGVTKHLADVRRFNPMFGGQLMVWRDPEDGKTYVINGHHRLELAQRSEHYKDDATGLEWHGELQSYYIPAKSHAQARAMGALANMAAGHGTATDAAKFMRDTGATIDDLKGHGVSLRGKVATDAVALKDLSQRAFEDVVQGRLPESRAIAVAKHLHDTEQQDRLLGLLAARERSGRPVNDESAEEAANEMKLAGSTKAKGGGLFADDEHDLTIERGEVKSAIRKALTSERNTFKAVSSTKRAARIQDAGNVLDVEGNKERARLADESLGMFDTLANSKSAVSDAIQKAAEDYYHAPTRRDEIIRELVGRLPAILDSEWRQFQSGRKEPEQYQRHHSQAQSRGFARSARRGSRPAGPGSDRAGHDGARSVPARAIRAAIEAVVLTQALRPVIEQYALHHSTQRWDESKHPRGQPQNAGQFSHVASTGSHAATSSAEYRPAKPLTARQRVDAKALVAALTRGRTPEQAVQESPARPSQPPARPEGLAESPAHQSQAVAAVEREYPPANHNGADTLERHRLPDGSLTRQRKALHDKIINSLRGHVPPSANRTFFMMGGGPASGKSNILHSGQVVLPPAVHVDSDAIKTQLPEYNGLQGEKDLRAAAFVHEESSAIAKSTMAQSFAGGQDTLLDGTGNASLEGVEAKCRAARQAGYKVQAEYVTCSIDEALRRNLERAKKTGRLPPEAFLRATHASVSRILPEAIAKGLFDNVRLWDTENKDTSGNPTLVASAVGSQLTVHNPQLWDAFVAKGK